MSPKWLSEGDVTGAAFRGDVPRAVVIGDVTAAVDRENDTASNVRGYVNALWSRKIMLAN